MLLFLIPAFATKATTASGLINGFATILLTVLLDPRIALLTERALQSEEGAEAMSKMYAWLMISRLFWYITSSTVIHTRCLLDYMDYKAYELNLLSKKSR